MVMLVSSAKVAIKTRLKESQGGHALTPNNVVWPSSYACAQLYHPRNNLVPRVVSLLTSGRETFLQACAERLWERDSRANETRRNLKNIASERLFSCSFYLISS